MGNTIKRHRLYSLLILLIITHLSASNASSILKISKDRVPKKKELTHKSWIDAYRKQQKNQKQHIAFPLLDFEKKIISDENIRYMKGVFRVIRDSKTESNQIHIQVPKRGNGSIEIKSMITDYLLRLSEKISINEYGNIIKTKLLENKHQKKCWVKAAYVLNKKIHIKIKDPWPKEYETQSIQDTKLQYTTTNLKQGEESIIDVSSNSSSNNEQPIQKDTKDEQENTIQYDIKTFIYDLTKCPVIKNPNKRQKEKKSVTQSIQDAATSPNQGEESIILSSNSSLNKGPVNIKKYNQEQNQPTKEFSIISQDRIRLEDATGTMQNHQAKGQLNSLTNVSSNPNNNTQPTPGICEETNDFILKDYVNNPHALQSNKYKYGNKKKNPATHSIKLQDQKNNPAYSKKLFTNVSNNNTQPISEADGKHEYCKIKSLLKGSNEGHNKPNTTIHSKQGINNYKKIMAELAIKDFWHCFILNSPTIKKNFIKIAHVIVVCIAAILYIWGKSSLFVH